MDDLDVEKLRRNLDLAIQILNRHTREINALQSMIVSSESGKKVWDSGYHG